MINGHCECGQVRYEVDGEITDDLEQYAAEPPD